MIAENNLEAWEYLYDKYEYSMYAIICNLTGDRTLAEEIRKESFLLLKEKQILSKGTYALCTCSLRHSNIFARQQPKAWGLTCSNSPINIICFQNISLNQAASNFNITEEEVKKNFTLNFWNSVF
ncbi:MAG: hypothetical protein ABIT08_11005 [Bacteroidia bacterium]